MENMTAIRRSNLFSMFMYVMILTCDLGTLDEGIVSSLARITWSALKNASHFSYALEKYDWCPL